MRKLGRVISSIALERASRQFEKDYSEGARDLEGLAELVRTGGFNESQKYRIRTAMQALQRATDAVLAATRTEPSPPD